MNINYTYKDMWSTSTICKLITKPHTDACKYSIDLHHKCLCSHGVYTYAVVSAYVYQHQWPRKQYKYVTIDMHCTHRAQLYTFISIFSCVWIQPFYLLLVSSVPIKSFSQLWSHCNIIALMDFCSTNCSYIYLWWNICWQSSLRLQVGALPLQWPLAMQVTLLGPSRVYSRSQV